MQTPSKSRAVPIIVLLLVLIALAGLGFYLYNRPQSAAPQAGSTYSIGLAAPLTGKYSEWGQYLHEGIQLAEQDLAATGARLQPDVHLEDTRSSVRDALAAFAKITDGHQPLAVITMDSETAKALAPVATNRQIVLLVTIAGGSDLFTPGQWAFRWYQNAGSIGTALARYASGRGWLRLGVIHENHIFANSVQTALAAELARQQGTIIAAETFNPDAETARDQAAKVMQQHPQAIVVSGTGGRPYVSAIRSLRELGWRGPILCDDSMNLPNVQRDVGDAAQGIVFTTSAFDPKAPANERQKHFVRSYQEKFGRLPTDTAAYSYELLLMLHDQVAAGAGTSRELLQAFTKIKDHDTVFGRISFAGDHELTMPMALRALVMRDGVLKADPAPSN